MARCRQRSLGGCRCRVPGRAGLTARDPFRTVGWVRYNRCMIEITRHRAIKSFADKGGDRRVVIEQRDDGLAQFIEECFYGDPAEDDEHVGWQPVATSGLYPTATDAERAAVASTPWLRTGS